MNLVVLVIAAYLLGSFPTALVIGRKYYNKDIREEGSGNLGGTNAGRVLGKKTGMIVSVLDILKVLIPAVLSRIFFNIDTAAIVGVCAMIGHCYPAFAGFRGGKGVSSYLGIGLALNPFIAAGIFVVWILLRRVTNYVSLSSMIACVSAAIIILFVYGPGITFYVMLAAALFVIFLHRSNIIRLIKGTENKIKN